MDFTDFTSCGTDHVFTFVKKVLCRSRVLLAFTKNIWKARNPGNEDGTYDLSFDYPRLIKTSTKKAGFFWVPNILKEIKDSSHNRGKPSEPDRFVDEQTRMKWQRKFKLRYIKNTFRTHFEYNDFDLDLFTQILFLNFVWPVPKSLSVKLRLI